jgi:hypothetical protein
MALMRRWRAVVGGMQVYTTFPEAFRHVFEQTADIKLPGNFIPSVRSFKVMGELPQTGEEQLPRSCRAGAACAAARPFRGMDGCGCPLVATAAAGVSAAAAVAAADTPQRAQQPRDVPCRSPALPRLLPQC